MIVGTLKIDREAGVLETTNDSYPLDRRTVVSVVLPFRAIGWMGAVLLTAFTVGFHDLLLGYEIAVCVGTGMAILFAGETVAQLVLTNRDLRGSDPSLSIAGWGTYRHLNRFRRELSSAARSASAVEDAA